MLTVALATGVLLSSVHDTELRRLDPVTLAPVGAHVQLDGRLNGGWTSRGTKLALGVTARGRIQIVDGRRSQTLQTGHRDALWLLSWPREDRILGVGTLAGRSATVVVADPTTGRVVREVVIDGRVITGRATADGLALIVAPLDGVADAVLALIDGEGSEHRITLAGVPAGDEPAGSNPDPRSLRPDVVVRDGRAYVATDTRVVEVDLADGAQRAHAIFGARAAKRVASQRSIESVGPHQLAVSGMEVGHTEAVSAGLRVVDTRTWGVKVLARGGGESDVRPGEGRGARPLPGGGFAGWPSNRGLSLFTAEGDRRVTALRKRRIAQLQVADRYAYAVAYEPKHRTYVVELSSGRVVKTLPTAMPPRLLG